VGVGEDWDRGLLGLAGDMVDVSCLDICVVLYISYSKVKEIMKKLGRESKTGMRGLRVDWRGAYWLGFSR
jgi:hypothetical protein